MNTAINMIFYLEKDWSSERLQLVNFYKVVAEVYPKFLTPDVNG